MLSSPIPSTAEKDWRGDISHPAILGDSLSGARIVLGAINGRCSREFRDLLLRDFLAHGLTIIPDSESKTLSDSSTPADIISAEISACQALPREPMIGSGLPAMHISRTEGHFQATLRVVDFSTGNELVTQTLRADPFKENQSQAGSPEYPAPSDLIEIALGQAVTQTRRLYAPWSESKKFVFMDDKDCNLKQSWELLHAGDYHGLLRTAEANALSCKANAKAAAAAWYDFGIACMLVRNYESALSAFEKSRNLREIRQTAELVAECRRNKTLDEAVARQIVAWVRQQPAVPESGGIRTGILFTNDLVIRLIQGNVAEQDILRLIRSQPNRFSLEPQSIAILKDGGVPDRVISAMSDAKH